MKEKNIPLKNYILLSLVLILSIVIVIYFYKWYGTYEENRINTPIMDKCLTVINYNELENYLVENKDAVIYFSLLGDEEVRKFERKFENFINTNSLSNVLLYLDLSKELKNKILFNNIKRNYSFNELPCLIIFENGVVSEVYSIKANGYDIDHLVSFLKFEGVISD